MKKFSHLTFQSRRSFHKKPVSLMIASLFLATSHSVFADEKTQLEKISVNSQGVEERLNSTGKLKDDVVQTEVIDQKTIERKQAGSLSQAIQNQPGVRVSTECSMCGVKRIMLNGLKGEHTTLMIDGVPNSSILEGFYGFDSLPTAGISTIEISRGSGAALIAPGAIGGVVNVISEKPREPALDIDVSRGTQGYQKYQVVGKTLSKDGRTRAMIAGQSDNIDQYDQDNNGINESPLLKNHSVMAKVWHDFTPNDSVSFRISDQHSEVFGGPMIGGVLAQSKADAVSRAPSGPGFVGDNVNNQPDSTTSPRDWLENIVTTKQEYTSKWIHEINSDWNTVVTGSYVASNMDAIYEGVTYQAQQDIYYADVKANYFATDQHFVTFGLDTKLDTTKTNGTSWDSVNSVWMNKSPNDAYKNTDLGIYVRDIWTPAANLEISAALRVDKIDVEFTDQNRKFDETMIAPRLHLRYDHSLNWTSRFSVGRGYRVPLQFFESEHGIIDNGFEVAVDKLETSTSGRYSLSFTGVQTDVTASISTAQIDNLATLEDRAGVPTLISTNTTSQVSHADISASYNFGDHKHWTLSGTIEAFQYDSNYRDTFAVIPVEERLRLGLAYFGHGWDGNISAVFVGERNYKDYQKADYSNHYNDKAMTKNKGDKSPAFYTVDAKLSKEINKTFTVYTGVDNLTDYTQTSNGDSPLFFDDAGNLDVTHIWGPLRGRVIYAGVKASF